MKINPNRMKEKSKSQPIFATKRSKPPYGIVFLHFLLFIATIWAILSPKGYAGICVLGLIGVIAVAIAWRVTRRER